MATWSISLPRLDRAQVVGEDYLALRRNGLGGVVAALAWKNLSKVPQFLMRAGDRG